MNRRNALQLVGGAALAAAAPALLAETSQLSAHEVDQLQKEGWSFHVWLNGQKQRLVVGFDQRAGWIERCRAVSPYGEKAPFLEPVHGDWRNWHEDDECRLATEKVFGRVEFEPFRRPASWAA